MLFYSYICWTKTKLWRKNCIIVRHVYRNNNKDIDFWSIVLFLWVFALFFVSLAGILFSLFYFLFFVDIFFFVYIFCESLVTFLCTPLGFCSRVIFHGHLIWFFLFFFYHIFYRILFKIIIKKKGKGYWDERSFILKSNHINHNI